MSAFLASIADHPRFQLAITLVILIAGALVGVETYPGLAERFGDRLDLAHSFVLGIFILEIVIKMGAHGSRPWLYFRDGWNVFDFLIVAACFLPVGSEYAMVLRLARLLRVLKLVRALPKLQLLVSALLKSIPSMAYISLLLVLLFYVWGCAGVFLFSKNDPVHFGNLDLAMLSLFRVCTLEDWTDVMYTQMYGCDLYGYGRFQEECVSPEQSPLFAPAYFVSFILLGSMIILNLFVGVIMNAMHEAQLDAEQEEEFARRARDQDTISNDLITVQMQLQDLQQAVAFLARRAATSERKRLMSAPPRQKERPREDAPDEPAKADAE